MNQSTETVVCKVWPTHNSYQTSAVRGMKARCTAGPEAAAKALGRKLFGDDLVGVMQLPISVAGSSETQWRIEANVRQVAA